MHTWCVVRRALEPPSIALYRTLRKCALGTTADQPDLCAETYMRAHSDVIETWTFLADLGVKLTDRITQLGKF